MDLKGCMTSRILVMALLTPDLAAEVLNLLLQRDDLEVR